MFVRAAGLTFHVQITGPDGAPPLFMLHSLGTSLHVWDEQAAALSARFRVIRPDLRGHGLTTVTPGPYTIEGMARDMLALLDALGIGRTHLAGLSIGGMVAQALAALAPARIASVMLCDTAMAIPPAELWHQRAALVRAEGMASVLEPVLARWVTPGFLDSPETDGLRAMLRRTDPEGYAGAAEAIAADDRSAATATLRLPALVLVGAEDAATPLAAAEALRAAIPGARLAVIPASAHIPTVEQPEMVSEALLRFLETLPPV